MNDNIVLIEIRDGPNPDSNTSPDSAANQENFGKAWGPGDQLFGPLKTFYNAGHGSVTRRNRRELCLLETALNTARDGTSAGSGNMGLMAGANRREGGMLHIQHFVFEFNPRIQRTVAQPLSWHLTQADKMKSLNRSRKEVI